jgi:hypothetical protein
MKNNENADRPMSAIEYFPAPFRLSGKAAQASCSPVRRRLRISTPTLNQKPKPMKTKNFNPRHTPLAAIENC